ncbi:MAG TPA: hypothetical protein VFJ72_08905 [Rubrobacteraceae bacterium]|nr:hypothetical protein [Rubrobacteraceae bacterium]
MGTFAGNTGITRTWPVLVVLVSGLLTYFAPHDEAYAGADYGISLLATLGAAGCIGYLASRISLRLDLLPRLRPAASGLLPSALTTAGPETGEDWPVLVALLFGLFLMLLAGLGGWV